MFQLLLGREFCQSRGACLLQGDLIRVRGHNIMCKISNTKILKKYATTM